MRALGEISSGDIAGWGEGVSSIVEANCGVVPPFSCLLRLARGNSCTSWDGDGVDIIVVVMAMMGFSSLSSLSEEDGWVEESWFEISTLLYSSSMDCSLSFGGIVQEIVIDGNANLLSGSKVLSGRTGK